MLDPNGQTPYEGTLDELNAKRAEMDLPPVRDHQLRLQDPHVFYISKVDPTTAMAVYADIDIEEVN